ncbi:MULTISPECIES: ABC transporter ATP-binding protein [Oceanobacillus]|uniref:ABC transporter ATP-binding protein n=2 Tax=Oceanobacillus TaxID=182709 RepID=A0ABV9K322_9BACI|nr:ABC transporter ATP-binding protein [Oceanobacillus oncorhynchi]MDM8099718.1 ABC transporter ATP-binding protein [Oceanobacillus oncorhynchi]UUI41833.1 ABC transporter ATP-binding protein [Oceanobacillus oncorhynchi]CEI83328.1 putative ABC transporter ATP-binding protein YxlF [Oceanobacillus oncorhynchi]
MMQLSNMSKSFGKQTILQDVSIDISANQITGLIGPSGTGKTTLIKCLMGMEKYDTGSIQIDDTAVPNRKLLNKIGYMAQSDSLYHDLTGLENIQFFAHMYGRKISNKAVQSTLNLVQLEQDKNKLVAHYSGGMKRRLSLAIALINQPEYLILDEPTVGIDPVLKLNIWDQLHDLKKESTLLITTHIMDEAMKCDQLLLMKNKGIAASGTPQEILENFGVSDIDQVFLKLEEIEYANASAD